MDGRLKKLEDDLKHEQDLRRSLGAQVDAHDQQMKTIRETLDVVGNQLRIVVDAFHQTQRFQAENDSMIRALAEAQIRTDQSLKTLIEGLSRGYRNGTPPSPPRGNPS